MSEAEHAIIVNGIAALAVSGFEMGWPRDRVRAALIAQWIRLDSEPGVFGEAAAAIASFPQPIVESAEKTERMRPIREQLGAQSADEQLVAAIDGRELLEELAAEFD